MLCGDGDVNIQGKWSMSSGNAHKKLEFLVLYSFYFTHQEWSKNVYVHIYKIYTYMLFFFFYFFRLSEVKKKKRLSLTSLYQSLEYPEENL